MQQDALPLDAEASETGDASADAATDAAIDEAADAASEAPAAVLVSPGSDNPFGNCNLVLGYYCSSDLWTGDRGEVIATSIENTGSDYRIHFHGSRIVRSAVEQLASGVTSDDGEETVGPLGDGALVLFTGSSAGGFGVSHNADAIADAHPTWDIVAVVDGNMQPTRDDFAASVDQQVDQFNRDAYEPQFVEFWGSVLDESCLQLQADDYVCTDQSVHLLNHLTTPLFVRQDIADSLLRRPYLMFGAALEDYAQSMKGTLELFADVQTTAPEGEEIERVPGVFGTRCGQHTTLSSDTWFGIAATGNASLDDTSGTPRTLAQALSAWVMGNDVALLDNPEGTRSTCALAEDTGD